LKIEHKERVRRILEGVGEQIPERTTLPFAEEINSAEVAQDEGGGAEISS